MALILWCLIIKLKFSRKQRKMVKKSLVCIMSGVYRMLTVCTVLYKNLSLQTDLKLLRCFTLLVNTHRKLSEKLSKKLVTLC